MTTMTSTVSPDRFIPVREVAKRLGIVADAISTYGVTVHKDWAGQPVISESDAAWLRDHLREVHEANRRRKAEAEAQRAAEAQALEDERQRRFWTAYAAVVECGGPDAPRYATGIAYSVIHAEDPEEALQRVIKTYGKPSDRAILYLMGNPQGRPRWMK